MVLSSIWAKWRMKRRAFFKHVSEIFSIYRLESELPENVCNFFNIGFFFFFPENRSHWGLKVHDSLIFVYFSWKNNFKKKFFSRIIHSFNMKIFWKKFFFEIVFSTEIYTKNHFIHWRPQRDLYSGKKKKKNPILKKLQTFSGNLIQVYK